MTVSGNSASIGGGVYNAGTLNVAGSTLSSNSAGFDGGAIDNVGGTITLADSTFSGNSVTRWGGAINNSSGLLTATDSTFADNSTPFEGGGIANGGTTSVLDSTFSGNSAQFGGAIESSGTATVTGSTLSGNSASSVGGGFWTVGTANIANTIVAGNTVTGIAGIDPDVSGGFATTDHDLIGIVGDASGFTDGNGNAVNGNLVGTAASPIDPKLGPLQDNGGLTQTMAVLNGSPAIDKGDNSPSSTFPAMPATDQRGFTREVADIGPGFRNSGTVDIGAFEVQPTLYVAKSFYDTDASSPQDFEVTSSPANGDTVRLMINPKLGSPPLPLQAGVSAFTSIQAAIDAAGDSGDTIEVAAGTYQESLDIISPVVLQSIVMAGEATVIEAPSTDFGTGITINTNSLSSTVIDGFSVSGFALGVSVAGGSTATLRDSTVSSNGTAASSGGGINNQGTLTVAQSTVRGNQAADGAGAFNTGVLTVINSTLAGNTASSNGGGIDNVGVLSVESATIGGNAAGGQAGGIFNGGTANIANTIVATNTAQSSDPDVSGSFQATDHDLIGLVGDASGFTNNAGPIHGNLVGKTTAVNPRLGPLADNGGPTQTMALLAGSHASDTGDSAPAFPFTTLPAADQRGLTRVVDGKVDIGAFEVQPTFYVANSFFDQTTGQQTSTPAVGDIVNWLASGRFSEVDNLTFGTNAFSSIQDAANAAPLDAQIDVAAGTYIESVSLTQPTILSGADMATTTIEAPTASLGTGIAISATQGSVTVEGLTVSGFAFGTTIASGSTAVLSDDTFSHNNNTTSAGGGISNNGVLSVIDCTITGNSAGSGGGIGNNRLLFVIDSNVSGNSGVLGGGIFNNQPENVLGPSAATLVDSVIDGNTASDESAGILNNIGCLLTVTGSSISGNIARFNDGGIDNISIMALSDSTITDNSVTSTNGNTGGIFTNQPATLTNCTISGNSAAQSAGIVANILATLTNCTITGNTAVTKNGGLASTGDPTPGIKIANTIIAGNHVTGVGGTDPDVSGDFTGSFSATDHDLIGIVGDATGFTDSNGNAINGNLVGTAASPLDPKLGPLADNGGLTQTIEPLPGSPAIDAGDNSPSAFPPTPATDQRGFARIVNGTVDIGSFEVQPSVSNFAATSGGTYTVELFGPNGPTQRIQILSANGNVVADSPAAYTKSIKVTNASGQPVQLVVDSSAGAIPVPVTFDGGTATGNSLVLQGGTATSDVYAPGPNPGEGTDTLVIGGVTESVHFLNLTPVYDSVSGPLTVSGTTGTDAITAGATANTVTVNNLESIAFSNKTGLTLNGDGGDDAFDVTPGSITLVVGGAIEVNGADGAGATVTVNGTASIGYGPTGPGAGNVTTAGPTVFFTNIAAATVNGDAGADTLTFNSMPGPNRLQYTPGASPDAGTITGHAYGGVTFASLNFENLGVDGSVDFHNGGGRVDTLDIYGTPAASNDFEAVGGLLQLLDGNDHGLSRSVSIQTAGENELALHGLNDGDTFSITGPLPYSQTFLDSTGAATATLSFPNTTGTVNLGTQSVEESGSGSVNFTGLATVNINNGSGAVTVADSAKNNTLDVTPTAANTSTEQIAGQTLVANTTSGGNLNVTLSTGDGLVVNGSQFNDTMNVSGSQVTDQETSGPGDTLQTVAFTGAASLTVNGNDGSDTFNVTPWAILPIVVDGGNPIGVKPGNTLNLMAGGSPVTFNPGPTNDSGGYLVAADQPVSFTHIETFPTYPGPVSASTVSFGSPNVPNSGLEASSDSGIVGQPATLADNITADSTPTFFGTAEPGSIVRLYADMNGTGQVTTNDVLIGEATADSVSGQWTITSTVNLNNPQLGFAHDGLRTILAIAQDAAGNVSNPQSLAILLDTQGPQIGSVSVTGKPSYNVFLAEEPTPTPLVNSLNVTFTDPVARSSAFTFPAVNPVLATTAANYQLVGRSVGVVPISSVTFTDNTTAGGPGTSVATLHFATPLPDDYYTLTVSDAILDNAGNALAGAFNGSSFPTGNGSAGSFSGSFVVNSRPHLAVANNSSISLDINGDGTFNPSNIVPDSDLTQTFGLPNDRLFSGKFASPSGTVSGFDQMGAYGSANGQWRWLLNQTPSQGTSNPMTILEPLNIDGQPVAGYFAGNPSLGMQVGLFSGGTWYLDLLNHHTIDQADVNAGGKFKGNMKGQPIVGDFDGDGKTDLATYQNGVFQFDLSSKDPGGKLTGNFNATINASNLIAALNGPGANATPVAADVDGDGITDLGLFVSTGLGGPNSNSVGQWYWLVSNDAKDAGGVNPAGAFASLNHAFNPTPLGNDLSYQFGTASGMPLIGIWDPPTSAQVTDNSAPTTGWVPALYATVLGRQATAGEVSSWNSALANGQATNAQAAQMFVESSERLGSIINGYYEQYLGRASDPAGVNYWISVWQANGGSEQVQAGIIGSAEYYATAGKLYPHLSADAAWVTALYNNLLGRDPDQQGLDFWVNFIQTNSRQSVVLGFVTSTEYRLGLIDGWFEQYLGRPVDPSSRQYLVNLMEQGITQDHIQVSLLTSTEFVNRSSAS